MGFKVGQKFFVHNVDELQLENYRNGDTFEVTRVDELGAAWDSKDDLLWSYEYDSPHLELINEPLEELLDRPERCEPETSDQAEDEYTGKSVSYYKIPVDKPFSGSKPYVVEVIDIIRALDMNFVDGNQLKSLIRRAVAQKFGLNKKGYMDGVYDAEKMVFFAEIALEDELAKRQKEGK